MKVLHTRDFPNYISFTK